MSSPAWLRLVAFAGIFATVFGRALAPGARGLVPEAWSRYLDFVGGSASQLALLLGAIGLVGAGFSLLRSEVPLLVRVLATATAGLVLGLALPSAISQPSAALSVFLSLSASATGLLASSLAIGSPKSRAVGIAIFLLTLAAMTHECAWVLAVRAGEAANVRTALLARTIALGALILEGLAVALGLLWLATRPRPWVTLLTSVSTALAISLAVLSQRAETTTSIPVMLVGRSGWLLGTTPPADVPQVVRTFFPALRLTLAFTCLFVPGRDKLLAILLALALLGGVDLDLAVCALLLATAAVTAALPQPEEPDTATISPR